MKMLQPLQGGFLLPVARQVLDLSVQRGGPGDPVSLRVFQRSATSFSQTQDSKQQWASDMDSYILSSHTIVVMWNFHFNHSAKSCVGLGKMDKIAVCVILYY